MTITPKWGGDDGWEERVVNKAKEWERKVEAAEAAEQLGRDVSALHQANMKLRDAEREARQMDWLPRFGEETEGFDERLRERLKRVSSRELRGELEVMKELDSTILIAEPVATWSGAEKFGQLVMHCEDNCKYDLYLIGYSFFLRTCVILSVVRGLEKEKVSKCLRSK